MRTLHKFIIVIGMAIGIFFACLPFFVDERYLNSVKNGIDLLSKFTSVGTFVIAILLYQNIKSNIQTEIVKRQLNLVNELRSELAKLTFRVKSEEGLSFIRLSRMDELRKILQKTMKTKMILNASMLSPEAPFAKVENLLKNVEMPQSIRIALDDFSFYHGVNIPKTEASKFATISFLGTSMFSKEEEETYLHFNDMNYLVEDYLKIWENISIASEKWIKQYSN